MSVERVSVPAEEGITNTIADNSQAQIERPSWLPDNFETPEAFVKSHKELQSAFTKKSQELAEIKKTVTGKETPSDQWKEGDAPKEASEEAPKEGETPKVPTTVEEAKSFLPGFSQDEIQEISDYAWKNEGLTDEHYAKLEKAGYSREVVDQFMAGQFAVVEGQRAALVNAGGGEERVADMFKWAAENLDAKTIKMYDDKFDAGGPEAIMAMENLRAKYEQSGVALPTGGFIRGANATGGDTSVFRSTAQVVEAMQDPRYKVDPAYRKEVEQKLARSKVF